MAENIQAHGSMKAGVIKVELAYAGVRIEVSGKGEDFLSDGAIDLLENLQDYVAQVLERMAKKAVQHGEDAS